MRRAVAFIAPLLVVGGCVVSTSQTNSAMLLPGVASPADSCAGGGITTAAGAAPAAVRAPAEVKPGYVSMVEFGRLLREAGFESFGYDVLVNALATMWHESGEGKIRAENPSSGAAGLAQVMPSNYQNLGLDPWDPVQNLRMAKMLADERVRAGRDPLGPWESYTTGRHRANVPEAKIALEASMTVSAPPPPAVEIAPASCTSTVASAFDPASLEKSVGIRGGSGAWGGHSNGLIPLELLAPLPGQNQFLRIDARDSFMMMSEEYARVFGRPITVTDAYRDLPGQISCRARKGDMCADPGTSNHGWGLAVDYGGGIQTFGTPQHRWMQQNAPRFGWVHPGWARQGGRKPEAWHWEFVGLGPGVFAG